MSTANLLPRTLEVPGAVMLGLGSIFLGMGVFVSLGLAAGIAEPEGLRALGLAAFPCAMH
jgi:basic amino acid/polyamine antiporter, APA family